jgi:hypothetical protein
VGGHGLGVFQGSAGLKIGGYSSCAEDVAAELLLKAGLNSAPARHAVGVDAVHRVNRELAGLAARGAEEGAFSVLADPSWPELTKRIRVCASVTGAQARLNERV